MPNQQSGPSTKPSAQDQVQADNLLSQPDPDALSDSEGVAEEVSLDQQSGAARRVGQLPQEAEQAVGESLKQDRPSPH